ncbi:MAG: CPBP family intramembrane metalloprotease [Chitinophagaceae bacterium]|nr:CPBP family intramembrane metalloprotease [Chitinophagaceae bacterium]
MQPTNPLIKQAWLRVLLFVVAYITFLIFSATITALVLSAVFNGKANENLPDFYIYILLNFIAGFFMVWLFRRLVDRKSFKSLGWQWKGFAREGIAGFTTGIFLCCVIAVVLWLMQLLQWFTDDINIAALASSFVLMMLVALVEELVFRGYILGNLMETVSKEAALLMSAFIFAAAHSLNPEFNLTAFLNILLAGLLLGINFIYTRNLWFGIFLHFTWNYLQGPLLGFKVSGLELPSLLQQNLNGSVLLTGGEFGLEASWLAVIAFLLALPVFYLLFQKKYQQLPPE